MNGRFTFGPRPLDRPGATTMAGRLHHMTHRAGERDVAPARPNVETTGTPNSDRGTPRRVIERLAGGPDLPDLDLLLVVATMAIAVVAVIVALPAPLRLPIALPAAILLPGYAIAAALFPPGELDGAERFALSFGLSLALVVVAAPVINLTVPGLTAPVVVSFVAAVTWGAPASLRCAAAGTRNTALVGIALRGRPGPGWPSAAGRSAWPSLLSHSVPIWCFASLAPLRTRPNSHSSGPTARSRACRRPSSSECRST